jgi:hypothetical protein
MGKSSYIETNIIRFLRRFGQTKNRVARLSWVRPIHQECARVAWRRCFLVAMLDRATIRMATNKQRRHATLDRGRAEVTAA